MHEMAIAEGILDITLNYAERENAGRVERIGLLVGEMAGVEEESLKFCFSSLTRGTVAEGATLLIKRVPLVGKCEKCGRQRKVERYSFVCSECGGALSVVSGRELRVEFLEME